MRAFLYAFRGIGKAVKSGRNFRIMLVCFVLVVAAGFIFGISGWEWIAVLLSSGSVLALEMINTALESLTDLATAKHHPLAEKAKDIAAGAVLVLSLAALAVGLIIFLPYAFRLFTT